MSRSKAYGGARVLLLAALFALPHDAGAVKIYVGGGPNLVGIIDQHPLDRGEALYDTQPAATGRYDRTVDADTMNPARAYDELDEYYDNSSAEKLNLSLINGAWYCVPTSALSLIKYWDADPRFPNLFDPAAGDTDRGVLLDLASRMDTDDVANRGGTDAQERHLGTRILEILPGLKGYVDARYPTFFNARELYIGQPGVTYEQVAAGFAAAVQNDIPVLLLLRNHMVVGTGFDTDFTNRRPEYFRVNDPWTAAQNVTLADVGRGRTLPNFGAGVFGISYADELYGPGADFYDEGPYADPEDALPFGIMWLETIDAPLELDPVPLPASVWLLGAALAGLAATRRGRARTA